MKYKKWLNKNGRDLTNKTYIVTGANSGIGYEVTRYLLFFNATVIMACRNKARAEQAISKLKNEFPHAKIVLESYDQSSFNSIENFVKRIENIEFDGLLCNAGIYFPHKELKTIDGFELTVGTNYIGVYYLIKLLKDRLVEKRVVLTTSLVARNSIQKDLNKINEISRNKRYAYSKLLIAELGVYLSDSLNQVCIVHPGVCATNILENKDTGLPHFIQRAGRRFLSIFTHDAKKGALDSFLGLTKETLVNGSYIGPRGLLHISGYPKFIHKPKKFYNKDIVIETEKYIKGVKQCY